MNGIARYITLSLLFFTQLLFAQKEAANWYFGNFAGLDFNSGSPVILNGGQTSTLEGVAGISDSNGRLLFYTDGIRVWNRQHQVMPNGTGLNGHFSSTQSALVVPVVGDPNRYYVFTIDDYLSPQRLQYSLVNMSLDSGRGDLEFKNRHLLSGVSEKLTAVRHCNQRDYWVITHSTFGNTYYAFLVSSAGVQTAPVISHTGTMLQGNSVGYLKASPDGQKLAAAFWTRNADLSDFDNVSGVVSNSLSLLTPSADTSFSVYGVEFSPNGKRLYATVFFNVPRVEFGDMLLQYDISPGSAAGIIASRQVIARQLRVSSYSALQLAINGKIYMAKSDKQVIAAINEPDIYGPGCGYADTAVLFTAASMKSMNGFPNFIQSYFFPKDSFTYSVQCPGNTVRFQKKPAAPGEFFTWDFGEPSSGMNNSSTLDNPSHIYARPGQYTVQLIRYGSCGNDTVRSIVETVGLELDLGADTVVCGNASLLLNPRGDSTYQYNWQDGSFLPGYSVRTAGTYWVEIKNSIDCSLRDSIRVEFDRQPVFSLGPDKTICPGDTLHVNPSVSASWQWRWQDGTTAPAYTIRQPGHFTLQASNRCGTSVDDIIIYPGACNVFVPTAFTPNNDGKNDLFRVLGAEKIDNLQLLVYNRWGELVFMTRDKTKGWNGTYRGQAAPAGNFVYLLEYTDKVSGKPATIKGSFLLIR